MTKPIRTTRQFDRLVKDLQKQHRRIGDDIAKFSEQLQRGERKADSLLRGVGGAQVYRARIANSSAKGGARGGFRITYFTDDQAFWLLHIGLRRDNDGINAAWLRQVLGDLPFD